MPDPHSAAPLGPIALYAGPASRAAPWRRALTEAAAAAGAAIRFETDPRAVAPEDVDYLLFGAWSQPFDMTPFTRLKAVLSLWAGVEKIVDRADYPSGVPLARMVEPGLTIGMTDYVVGHVLRIHLDLDGCRRRHQARRWDEVSPPLSSARTVGIMGLGALGLDAARALRALRFRVRGWSRSPKREPGIDAFVGPDALDAFLSGCEILVALAPLTPETRGLLNAARLAQLPEGAHVVNVARGPLVVEADLLAALDGRLGGATLDVFDHEPLPQDHPYWAHPKVLVTPHIASITRPETASAEIVAQILRAERGEPLHHLVDFDRGY